MSPVSERAAQVRFRRALSLMAMTLVAPGSAQLVAGNRRVGTIAFRIWLGLWALALLVLVRVLLDHNVVVRWAFSPNLLLWVKLALFALAVGWAALMVDAWRIGQPLTYGLGHRRMAVGVNGLLCFSVAGTLLFGAHLVGVHRDFVVTVFGADEVTGTHDGRYNVLLMGGDSGAGRWGLRPDSMTVASIDAKTGRTVLIGLPRNMENFTFKPGSVMDEQFPDGFVGCNPNGDPCYLNGVSTWAGDHTDLFPDSDDPGTDATIQAIEGITGLDINYWAMVNLEGFKDLVDAVGGVTLNVRQPIPVGGLGDDVTGYIDPGTRKLTGFETLWYARAREGSDDYSRMARQKCVMNAMLEQVSPTSAVTHFQDIAKASAEMISTNIPASEVDTFVQLAMKAKSQKTATLSLVPPLVVTAHPDVAAIQAKVADVIATSDGTATKPARKKKAKDGDAVTGGSIGTLADGYAANQADDLDATC